MEEKKLIKEYLSPTQIKTLHTCKKLFYHRYIIRDLPYEETPFAVLGKAVHKALEIYRPKHNQMNKLDVIREFKKAFSYYEQRNRQNGGTFKRDYFVKEGTRILYGLDYNKVVLGELVGVEIEFYKPVFGYPMKGVIDKLEKVGNTYVVTDYKTDKEQNPKEHIMQMAIYSEYIHQYIDKNAKITTEIFWLRANKITKFEFVPNENKMAKTIVETTAKMVNENHDNEAAWPQLRQKIPVCKYCPLRCFK